MQYSRCWIGQEYRFAGDIKRQRGQQAWGKSLRRLNRHWCMRGNASPQAQRENESTSRKKKEAILAGSVQEQ